ncbi:MAG TPA: hypothetical protein PLD10_22400 [Rhodopila sp.]|nr:hypothetical protein [Rhodopila sp.]
MQLIFRAAAAYWVLLFAVRLIGRRTASQMAPFDLVVLFLFAGITITAVLDDDHSMVGAFSGICTIGLMRLEQVRYAVAERDGKISIVQAEA